MSAGPYRLAQGGRIDRSQPLTFTFNGRALQGYAGDTLASALLANGLRVVSRSFKFHRPRGIMGAGQEEANALLRIEHDGRVSVAGLATTQPLLEGLRATSCRGFPGLGFDLLRVLDYTHALWPAGFYNKTFIWPGWHAWEWLIRRMAGLGTLPAGADTHRYYHHNLHCDVLVVGGGRAGVAEALEAARAGASVVLLELEARLGGHALAEPGNDRGHAAWLESAGPELAQHDRVKVLRSTAALGIHEAQLLTALDRSDEAGGVLRLWRIRAREVVLATGAIEQPLVFPGNDRPGVMLAGAARRYLHDYGVAVGQRVLIATNNDAPYALAAELRRAGIEVAMIADTREEVPPALMESCRQQGIEVRHPAFVARTQGARGIRAAHVQCQGLTARVDCDALLVSGGHVPASALLAQGAGVRVAGVARDGEGAVGPRWSRELRGRQWLDLAHDVTLADVELAVREGLESIEHLKRYTTAGMATDQGRTSSANVQAIFAELTGRRPADVGSTTARPPIVPVNMGALAGQLCGEFYAPMRRMPADAWHRAHGAVMQDYGGWQRPAWYAAAGEAREAAIRREALTVRQRVGLFEGSPLGKIELRGPDAGRFLERIYANSMASLAVGRLRYGLMLNENGVIIDDGVLARLDEDHYLVGTTSGNAARIAAWLDEWHQCEWPGLDLVIACTTAQWGVITVAGPQARALLQTLETDIDLGAEAMPHMSLRSGLVAGQRARLQRVSYCGELSFELSVAADALPALWERLMANGAALGVAPVGLEAWLLLRMEKGFLHVGTDTDGMTNALDVGFGAALARRAGDYVGRRSLQRANDLREDRRQLVGLRPTGSFRHWRAGAQLLPQCGEQRSIGVLTSACISPALGHAIGLGLLEGGRVRLGEVLRVFDEGDFCEAEVVSPVFYDPEGQRLHG